MATRIFFAAGPMAAAVRHSCRPAPAAALRCAASGSSASTGAGFFGCLSRSQRHFCHGSSFRTMNLATLASRRGFAAGPGPAATVASRTRPGTIRLLAITGVSLAATLVMYEVILWNVSSSNAAAGPIYPSSEWDPNWDNPECLSIAKHEVEALTEERIAALALEMRRMGDPNVQRRHLIFVRHAQPASSAPSPPPKASEDEGVVLPAKGGSKKWLPSALSAEGLKQAKLVGKYLKNIFEDVDHIYHGTTDECKATAKIISKALRDPKTKVGPATIESDLFDEVLPVVPSPAPEGFEGVDPKELAADAHKAECLFHGMAWVPTPKKDQQGLASVEVYVCPGNLMRYMVCRALQLPPSAWSRMAANHATVTWIEIGEDGVVTLREFGGTGHLSPDLMTYH